MTKRQYKVLADDQIRTLVSQGCSAEDWSDVAVDEAFDPRKVRNAHFAGCVQIGDTTGRIEGPGGVEKDCGIYNATIINCSIGDGTRIANVGVHIAHYDIGDNVCIENIAAMQSNPQATFGNGVEVAVLNEAGGREVVLFNELSVQFAYIMCLHRYRPVMIEKLKAMAADYVETIRSDRGSIGRAARIYSAGQIIDVNVGAYATINGASSLINGTILSSEDAPTLVGSDVCAEDFIIAESSQVTGGAMLDKVFVGQGCQVGKQYSAENSLFFANCEAFHGEACSVFAGPYTVTHHKSTLLIAGLFSFYNAGSGTNQSNHMYKLGPVHEGKLERGTKTGSFSYMMWPCRTGPFCVVLGKHTGTFDVSDFPFSHLEARPDGRCLMVPGLHLTTVGTVRDGAKWPKRDRRKGAVKRDAISFAVFSPYTVGKMLTARRRLKVLQDSTDRSIEEVSVGGALVRRVILRTGQKFYRTGVEMYLLEKVIDKAQQAVNGADPTLNNAFAADAESVYSDEWVDIGGQLMARDRLLGLSEAVESGKINTIEALAQAIEKIQRAYGVDEWAWVRNTYKTVFDVDLDTAATQDILDTCDKYLKVRSKFLNLVIADAEKEFGEMSRSGFGQDGTDDDAAADFQQVRGTYDANTFVREMKQSVQDLTLRIGQLKQKLEAL